MSEAGIKLNERWHSRDLPVLVEAARQLDSGQTHVDGGRVARALDLDSAQVNAALDALIPTYLQGRTHRAGNGEIYMVLINRLTDRGRRAVGLWPDEDNDADALIQLLEQAASQTDDEEDQSALRRAGRALRGVPAAVLADVTAALIRQQTGI